MTKITSIVLSILITALIVGGGTYYFTKNAQKKTIAPTAIPTPIPLAKETVDWQTYSNDNVGFSFKYPSTYTIKRDNLSEVGFNRELILEDISRSMSVNFIVDVDGFGPGFADYNYVMRLKDGGFDIDRQKGEYPEGELSDEFKIIADFGILEGSSKINGHTIIVQFRSPRDNSYQREFDKILESLNLI